MTFVKSLTVHQLGEGAGFALDAFRIMAAGGDQSGIVAAFDARFGFPGRAALGAMHMLVREIGTAGGRRVTVACPGCCRMTGDELSLLALLSAAQLREHRRLDAHVSWLLAGRDSETARSAALAVGGLFKGAGLAIEGPPVDVSAPARMSPFAVMRVVGNA